MAKRVLAASKPAVAWIIERTAPLAATTLPGTDREVGPNGVLFLVHLADASNTGTGEVWRTVPTWMRETGYGRTTVTRLLAGFQDLGWLHKVGTRSTGDRGGRGTPVYVLALVPDLADLYAAHVASRDEVTAQAQENAQRFPTSAQRPPIVPRGGRSETENVNNDGANRENVNPYPYPYPDATDAPTGELAPVVPMSQGGGEWGTIHDQVLAGCLAALPMDGVKSPEGWRAHHRKKLRSDIIPTVLANTRNPGPDQVPDLVARCLAAAFPERPPRASQGAPNARGGAALTQVAGMARTPTFGDDVIRDYIRDQDTAEHADLVAEVRRHRPTFTLGEEPGERATG